MARLKEFYKDSVVKKMTEQFGYTSVMQAPKLEKICLNRGINGAVTDKKLVDIALDELTTISGQKAVATNSKKDISNFKLRKNMPIGARVTLRGVKMYEFLDRLIAVALPRVRDFKGINEKSGKIVGDSDAVIIQGRGGWAGQMPDRTHFINHGPSEESREN